MMAMMERLTIIFRILIFASSVQPLLTLDVPKDYPSNNLLASTNDRGIPASIRDYPFLGFIEYTAPNDAVKPAFCAGTLYNETYVITSAFCLSVLDYHLGGVSPNQLRVYFNTTNVLCKEPGFVSRRVKSYTIHPNFNASSYYWNDNIAILTLSNPITTLPSVSVNWTLSWSLPKGTFATTVGWGTKLSGYSGSETLQKAVVSVVDVARCSANFTGAVYSKIICAAAVENGTYQGDLGSPILVGGKQVGITGAAEDSLEEDYPGVPGLYTRLYIYKNWITSITSKP